MIISNKQKEENFQEFLRLQKDPDYYDVTFDELSGGVSAVHKNHSFDKQMGPFGIKKGDYESLSTEILRKNGHRVILESETAPDGIKTPDGTIDGIAMDIKAVEGDGKWAIKDKFHDAIKKSVECVILYFHKEESFSLTRIDEGWIKFQNDPSSMKYPATIKKVLCIVKNDFVEYGLHEK